MSRISTGDTIVTKPTPNVYTVLAGSGFIVTVVALILFIMKTKEILGVNLWEVAK